MCIYVDLVYASVRAIMYMVYAPHIMALLGNFERLSFWLVPIKFLSP